MYYRVMTLSRAFNKDWVPGRLSDRNENFKACLDNQKFFLKRSSVQVFLLSCENQVNLAAENGNESPVLRR